MTGFVDFEMPADAPASHAVSSVRVVFKPSHDVLIIWNRGGYAGQLTLQQGDWFEYVARLGFVPSEPAREGEQRPTRSGAQLMAEVFERRGKR